LVVALLSGLLWLFYTGQNSTSMLMIVLLAGALGGFVSALKRIYAFQRVFPFPSYQFFKKSNLYLVLYSLIPPLIGAIGAVVLYVIFAAQLATSPMFPEFFCASGEGRCTNLREILDQWQPKVAQDYAKAAVWGFIAGFSERFVPDILNRIAAKGEDEKESQDKFNDSAKLRTSG
jgi:hypothetical protein